MERLADANADKAHTRFIVSDDPEEIVERIGTYLDLGFEDLLLHAPGTDQYRFLNSSAPTCCRRCASVPTVAPRRPRPSVPRAGARVSGRPRRVVM